MHLLVRSYLGYEAPRRELDDADDDAGQAGPLPGTNALPTPPGLTAGSSQADAIAAFERLFFGEMIDVEQLRH